MRNTIKTRSGRVLELPTPEENEAINRGIAADPDTHEASDEDFRKMRRRSAAPTQCLPRSAGRFENKRN